MYIYINININIYIYIYIFIRNLYKLYKIEEYIVENNIYIYKHILLGRYRDNKSGDHSQNM